MSINEKLFKLQNEIGAITKDATNPFFKSKYFDINALVDTLKPFLKDNGLLLLQPIEEGSVKSKLIDVESGDSHESSMPLPNIDDPQKMGSAVTYYRRYTLQSLLALQAEDDDANKASGKSSRKTKSKPKEEPKPKSKKEPIVEDLDSDDDYFNKIDSFDAVEDLVAWFNKELDARQGDEHKQFQEKYVESVRKKAAELY